MYEYLHHRLHLCCRITCNLSVDTAIIAMSSLFYTWLKKDGPEAVLKFHKNKNVLDADIIFVPITQDGHHSLCTIVNPGSIVNRYKRDLSPEARLPVLLFMDSKAIHDAKEIGHNL